MSPTEMFQHWQRLEHAIEILKHEEIIQKSKRLSLISNEIIFQSERQLFEEYLKKKDTSLSFEYSYFSHLRNAFDKATQKRNERIRINFVHIKKINGLLDDLIFDRLQMVYHPALGYYRTNGEKDVNDDIAAVLIEGCYIGIFKNKDGEQQTFLFIISRDKRVTLVSANQEEITNVIVGELHCRNRNQLFFVMRANEKQSPELIISHMGHRLNDNKKINHFTAISAWYDYKKEKPSAAACIFCKANEDTIIPSFSSIKTLEKETLHKFDVEIRKFFDHQRNCHVIHIEQSHY